MEVIRSIAPGDPGSKRFQKRWGHKLVKVRYRRNASAGKILTTVELIVDERDQPPPGISYVAMHTRERQQVVAIAIAWKEKELRKRIKQVGARWSQLKKVWLMKYNTAVVLGLQDRIIEGLAEKCTDVDMSLET